MYRNISMAQRLDRIGELLTKGVFLYLQKEKTKNEKEDTGKNEQDKISSSKE
jgi:hypothetical protein